jgi:hypothetical protein
MNSIQQNLKGLGRFIERNSNHILTGIAVTGTISATIFAIEATPKALQVIEEYNCRTTKEKIQISWQYYIPTGIALAIAITSIMSMNIINERKKAALAGLYTITQSTLNEYRQKVIETIGKNKERKIRDSIDADKISTNPPNDVIFTGSGSVLCLDSMSGRYFQSDIEKIKKIVNELNRQLILEMFIPLNDFYYELGLEAIKMGYDVGFNIDNGLLEPQFSSQLTKDGKPCLVINYEVAPKT